MLGAIWHKTHAPRLQENYITQVPEKIEGRVTKKMSQEFSRMKNRILGALAQLDLLLMNPLFQGHSGTTLDAFRTALSTKQGTIEDNSQSDTHPETGIFRSQTTQNSVTSSRSPVTMPWPTFGPYCSTSTSSGMQKKNRFTSQPQFCSENTPATIEADQILLAFQQLPNNNNSANFQNKIKRISKLPNSLMPTMPTFDGRSEKFEMFEDFFQRSFKTHIQLNEDDRINYFHSLMRGRCVTKI